MLTLKQCCNPKLNGGGGWGIFNSVFGWQNSATYGSVISYNLYWIVIIIGFATLGFYEKTGHWPLMKAKAGSQRKGSDVSSDEGQGVAATKTIGEEGMNTRVRSVEA